MKSALIASKAEEPPESDSQSLNISASPSPLPGISTLSSSHFHFSNPKRPPTNPPNQHGHPSQNPLNPILLTHPHSQVAPHNCKLENRWYTEMCLSLFFYIRIFCAHFKMRTSWIYQPRICLIISKTSRQASFLLPGLLKSKSPDLQPSNWWHWFFTDPFEILVWEFCCRQIHLSWWIPTR